MGVRGLQQSKQLPWLPPNPEGQDQEAHLHLEAQCSASLT